VNDEKTDVSVIVPVYNGERFITEAIESIHLQNHETLEIIVVDDGTTDNTARIAAGRVARIV
jgi:glycosyltransferase involved in cell wall biosynthesis